MLSTGNLARIQSLRRSTRNKASAVDPFFVDGSALLDDEPNNNDIPPSPGTTSYNKTMKKHALREALKELRAAKAANGGIAPHGATARIGRKYQNRGSQLNADNLYYCIRRAKIGKPARSDDEVQKNPTIVTTSGLPTNISPSSSPMNSIDSPTNSSSSTRGIVALDDACSNDPLGDVAAEQNLSDNLELENEAEDVSNSTATKKSGRPRGSTNQSKREKEQAIEACTEEATRQYSQMKDDAVAAGKKKTKTENSTHLFLTWKRNITLRKGQSSVRQLDHEQSQRISQALHRNEFHL
jgi:hypothetical protein